MIIIQAHKEAICKGCQKKKGECSPVGEKLIKHFLDGTVGAECICQESHCLHSGADTGWKST